MRTCGKYGCRNPLDNPGDIYCWQHGGRGQAVSEGLLPKDKPKLANDRRGVVPPGEGYAGTSPDPWSKAEKERKEREAEQKRLDAKRNRPKKQKNNENGKNKKKGDKDKKKDAKRAAKHG